MGVIWKLRVVNQLAFNFQLYNNLTYWVLPSITNVKNLRTQCCKTFYDRNLRIFAMA
jgi:hypothetical protein